MPNPHLVLKGAENLDDRELQRREILFHRIISSEQIWWKDKEHLFHEDRLSLVSILRVSGSFIRRLRLFSDITKLRSMVEGSLYCFLQLDVGLSS